MHGALSLGTTSNKSQQAPDIPLHVMKRFGVFSVQYEAVQTNNGSLKSN